MSHLWIWLAVTAAALQTVRTAAQKRMTERLSTLTTTYVRSLLGLPVMVVWLVALLGPGGGRWPSVSAAFLGWCLVAAVTQNIGTAALLGLYKLRNFAVANQLARTNLVFTALIGWLAFSEAIAPLGWAAIGLCFAGGLLLSVPGRAVAGAEGTSLEVYADWRAVRAGLIIGASFGLCNLTIREASLSLGELGAAERGATTVVVVTALQCLILGAWLIRKEPGFLSSIVSHPKLAALIGVTSALGSIAWFTAFSMANASYVIAVGQIEAVFGLAVSLLYFRERVTRLDIAGMGITMAGVLMLRAIG